MIELKRTFTIKHIFLALIVGALLMTTGQVLADTASQIGKKVDGESPVYVDGQRVSDAIIIKGKSYAPIRDISESLGASVTWKGSDGIMVSNEEIISSVIESQNENTKDNSVDSIEVSNLKRKISETELRIKDMNKLIETFNSEMQVSEDKEFYTNHITILRGKISAEELELDKLKNELIELESTK